MSLPFFSFQDWRLNCIHLIFGPLCIGCDGGSGERRITGLLVCGSLGWAGATLISVEEIMRCSEIVD